MSDREGLERAILEAPFDDAPRLTYADVLDEAGECDRAEFVRVQIAIADQRNPARRPPASEANDRFQNRLEGRERELLRELGSAWLGNADRAFTITGPQGVEVRERTDETYDNDLVYRFRRGFVDEVRLPLRAFCGGPCEQCQGNPLWIFTRCGGKRKFGGIAAALFARHPVTRVVLTCRDPDGENAWWRKLGTVRDPEDLPAELYDLLVGNEEFSNSTERFCYYPSREHALAALSDACVAYGRKLAGLPALASGEAPAAVG